MDARIETRTLSDGSEVFDVVLFQRDGGRVVFEMSDESSAIKLEVEAERFCRIVDLYEREGRIVASIINP